MFDNESYKSLQYHSPTKSWRYMWNKKSISYRGVEIWNNISDEIKNSENTKGFKGTYQKFLVSQYWN